MNNGSTIMIQPIARMFIRAVYIAIAVHGCWHSAVAQQTGPVAVYRERGDPTGAITTAAMFDGSGKLMFDVAGRGVYVVDTVSWNAHQITELDNMGAYEYSTIVRRKTGGVACLQFGSAGGRLWKFDEGLAITRDTLPERIDTLNYFTAVKYKTANTLFFSISMPSAQPPLYRNVMSFDGCDTWVDLPRNRHATLVANDRVGGALTQGDSDKYCDIVHPYSSGSEGIKPQKTPILARRNKTSETSEYFNIGFYGRDTVLWIDDVKGSMILGIGALGDTIAAFVGSSVQTAAGRTVNIVRNHCQIMYSATRRVFLLDSNGLIHEYRKGQWHTIDTLRFKHASLLMPLFGPEQVYYPTMMPGGKTGYTILHLNDSVEQEVRMKEYYDGYNNIRFYPAIHPNIVPATHSWNGPMILTLKSGRGYILSSTLRDIQDVEPYPMLYGFSGSKGEAPFIVSYPGHMVRLESSGVGRLVSVTTSGNEVSLSRSFKPSPSSLTTSGMRIPSVSASDILVPGVRLMQFRRDGTFLRIVGDLPSTSALRTDADHILIGNGTKIYRWSNDTIIDSVDVRVLLTSADSVASGFIGTMLAINDTTVISFVSGLHLFDNENLVPVPYRCGGIVRSADNGLSWKASNLPDQDPYFLGVIRVDSNVIVASYTTMVRDTLKRNNLEYSEERRNETLFTIMEDCHVIRSTDNGITWSKVYSRPVNKGFRFIGSSGVRLADGRLIINGIDGPLESFDNGLSWDYHEPGFNEATEVITFFTDDEAEEVHYCTTTGVFKNRLVTASVQDQESSTSNNQPSEARTWTSHLRAWSSAGYTCTTLTTLTGETLRPFTAPTPGVYVAQLADQGGRSITRKVMVIEE